MKNRPSDKFLLLLFLVLAVAICRVNAQPVQQMTPAQWHQLTDDKALNYKNDKELISPEDTYKQSAFEKAVMHFFRFLFGPAGTFIMWMLVIGLVIYIIYRLAIQNGGFLFGKSKKIIGDAGASDQGEEDIEATNWEKMLQQAMAANDTRLAVRYRYMWLLQILQQAGLIQYRNDKTNYDYYSELAETDFRNPFKQLSRLYEYAWYGNYQLTSAAYNDYLAHFDHLKNQLAR